MDEVSGAGADGGLRWPLQVDLEDAPVRLAVALGLKGRAAEQELVAQHPQAPHVHRRVVVPAFNHLRGQVVQSPAQRLPARTAGQASGGCVRTQGSHAVGTPVEFQSAGEPRVHGPLGPAGLWPALLAQEQELIMP